MNIEIKQPTVKGPPQTFTGDVWFDVVVPEHDYPRMRVNVVRFAPGARTAWHCHPGGQTLYVTEGRGLVQSRGGRITEIRPGDVIYTPPGEWHWHGAGPNHFIHLAMWEVDEQLSDRCPAQAAHLSRAGVRACSATGRGRAESVVLSGLRFRRGMEGERCGLWEVVDWRCWRKRQHLQSVRLGLVVHRKRFDLDKDGRRRAGSAGDN